MAALSATLEVSTSRAIAGPTSRGCDYHRAIARALMAGDTIISFNYDCVMDHALRAERAGAWEARIGYGFSAATTISGAGYWSPADPLSIPSQTIRLLKLHGSLNWRREPGRNPALHLKQRLHEQNGTPRFHIVPPEWNKSIRDDPILAPLWRSAFEAIQKAETIAVVGFSFAPTDLHAESLFRLGLEEAKLKTVVIANPSAEDRARIRAVFAPALSRGRGVTREYDSLQEMASAWPACIDE